jgi:hypothetical protein
MTSENNIDIDNERWNTIVKNTKSKPQKYIYKWIAHVTKKDITLTLKEKEMLANS